ncbi:enoyl-CoA hydratase [bacterium RCC_150]
MSYENILLERRDRTGVITLNRPEALNALSLGLMVDVVAAVRELDLDPGIGAILITGSERAFAAGADIKEMASKSYMEMYAADWFGGWDALADVRTPMIAAVAGYALGGGCELAMICDFILAADNAKFGQPEIKLGVIPGIGGSQRLTRAIGKSKAMEMILTGRTIDAEEAERCGLVSRVIPAADLLSESEKTAALISELSAPVAALAKDSVNMAFETHLDAGIRFERRVFHSLFSTKDQKEGMEAFVEKRTPMFVHE